MTRRRHRQIMATDQQQINSYTRHLAAGHSPATIRSYRHALQRAAECLPDGLCSETEHILGWLGSQRARNTRASYATALRGFYAWCAHTGRLDVDLSAEIPTYPRRRGTPRPVTHDQLATILAGAREPVRLWCLLAAYAGLRCCEISRLDRADVTAEVIHVAGKGDQPRAVPTHPEIWAAAAHLPGGPVAGCSPGAVSTRISRECQQRLGLTGVTAHRLRHWAGTWWQSATGDVRVTQELLGHASLANTMVYTAVADAAKRAAVLGLPSVTGATGAGAPPAAAGPRR